MNERKVTLNLRTVEGRKNIKWSICKVARLIRWIPFMKYILIDTFNINKKIKC